MYIEPPSSYQERNNIIDWVINAFGNFFSNPKDNKSNKGRLVHIMLYNYQCIYIQKVTLLFNRDPEGRQKYLKRKSWNIMSADALKVSVCLLLCGFIPI